MIRRAVAVVVLLAICIFVLTFFKLVLTDGQSMMPTFSPGDLVLCCRLYRQPKAGDVIVIQRNDTLLIKRVAAAPGEVAEAVDSTTGQRRIYAYWGSDDDATVPEGFFFVAGDNPAKSLDSRDPEFGLVKQGEIWGFVLTVIRSG